MLPFPSKLPSCPHLFACQFPEMFFQGMEWKPPGNHLLLPDWMPPAGSTGQWILSAGVGGTVFRKKVSRKRTAHGTSETQADLHNCVAETALSALLCQIAQDAGSGAWGQGMQQPQNAGSLQCCPFLVCSCSMF